MYSSLNQSPISVVVESNITSCDDGRALMSAKVKVT